MFVYVKDLVVERTVEIAVPRDGSGFLKAEVRVKFLILDGDQMDQQSRESEDGVRFWQKVIKDWDGFVDDKNEPIACTSETIEQMVKVPYVRKAFTRNYFATCYGNELRGNS